MNISEAKNQITETVRAYMSKDDTGAYCIDVAHQRPLFLIGAPGIGKTAIVEQVASEMGIGLVSYSMTHHTRQSALGLPFIEHKKYGDVEFDVSEYTMSEIIASMYDYMEKTGLKKGILFLDEINCVSETLYPSMLQFLQFKTFGRHSIPEDWIVVCAGNPPEYNRSVHEFDIVTMDRLRRIDIEPDYAAWKSYALDQGLHPAVTSYLEVRHSDFYMVEAKLGGKSFVTARGWEDLAKTITLFEQQETPVNAALVEQFLQDAEIAERFAAYYDLFNKYRSDYQIDEILAGNVDASIVERAQAARFDERLALLGLLLDSLGGDMFEIVKKDEALNMVREGLSDLKEKMRTGDDLFAYVSNAAQQIEGRLAHSKDIGTASAQATRSLRLADGVLREMMSTTAAGENYQDYATINQVYRHHAENLNQDIEDAQLRLDNAFAFIDEAFNQKRELLVFVTELTARTTTMKFLNRFGSDSYFAHNQDLLVEDNRQKIAERISELPMERITATAEAKQDPLGLGSQGGSGINVVPISLSPGKSANHARHAAPSSEDGAEKVSQERKPEPVPPVPVAPVEKKVPEADEGGTVMASVVDEAPSPESAKIEEIISEAVYEVKAAVDEIVAEFSEPESVEPAIVETGEPTSDPEPEAAVGTQAYHDKLVSYYANKTFEYGFNSMCKMTLPEFLTGKMILDIGCRRGRGVFKLSDRVGITGHVVGIDWSREHINEAMRDMDRAWQDSGLPESNMEFHWGFPEDLASLGLRENSMDLVFTNSILNLAYDTKQAIREIFRVLRFGGMLICETVVATGPRDKDVVAKARAMGNSVQSALSQEEFEAMLAEAGFSMVGLSYRDVHKVNPTDGYIQGYTVDAVESNEDVEFRAVVAHVAKPKANVLPRAIFNGGAVDRSL
ncbi:MAG: methyltransferase domain-containing protein [Eggerthellaceae bacterium]|nr:methyltransferase domain-containing protein [Eggerthellaceae bacterium]